MYNDICNAQSIDSFHLSNYKISNDENGCTHDTMTCFIKADKAHFVNYSNLKEQRLSSLHNALRNSSNLFKPGPSSNHNVVLDKKDFILRSSCPVILRRTLKNKSLKTSNGSPVKSLSFSPSRFLNIEKLSCAYTCYNECSKDSSLCNNASTEDSGIEMADIDNADTPQARCVKHFDHANSHTSPVHRNFCKHMQSTPKSNYKTPIIQRFLNESVLQTPTPFKCPDIRDCEIQNKLLNEVKSAEKVPCKMKFKKPLQKSFCESGEKLKKKSARKTLILDQTNQSLSEALSHQGNSTASFGQLSNCTMLHNARKGNSYDLSTLIEATTYVEKRKVTPNKSVYYTRSRTIKPSNFSNQWVSVACGKTIDQKDMVAAARRCLYQY